MVSPRTHNTQKRIPFHFFGVSGVFAIVGGFVVSIVGIVGATSVGFDTAIGVSSAGSDSTIGADSIAEVGSITVLFWIDSITLVGSTVVSTGSAITLDSIVSNVDVGMTSGEAIS